MYIFVPSLRPPCIFSPHNILRSNIHIDCHSFQNDSKFSWKQNRHCWQVVTLLTTVILLICRAKFPTLFLVLSISMPFRHRRCCRRRRPMPVNQQPNEQHTTPHHKPHCPSVNIRRRQHKTHLPCTLQDATNITCATNLCGSINRYTNDATKYTFNRYKCNQCYAPQGKSVVLVMQPNTKTKQK